MPADPCRCRICRERCDQCLCDPPAEPDHTTADAKRRTPTRTKYQRERKHRLLADAKCMDCGSRDVVGKTKTRCRKCLDRISGHLSITRAVMKILEEPGRRCYHWQAPRPTKCPICKQCIRRTVQRQRDALEREHARLRATTPPDDP